jgi:hypothetical protein
MHIRKIQYTTIKIPFSRLEPRAYKKENLSLLFQEKCHFYENSIIFETIHIKKIRFSTVKVLFFRENPRVQKTKIFFCKNLKCHYLRNGSSNQILNYDGKCAPSKSASDDMSRKALSRLAKQFCHHFSLSFKR